MNLAKKFPSRNFADDETGNPDDWGKLYPGVFEGGGISSKAYYIGKDYGTRSTEVLTMGTELLFNDPVAFAMKDPEFFKFIVGSLRGSF